MVPQHTSPLEHVEELVQAMDAPVHVAPCAMHEEPVVVRQQVSVEPQPEVGVHVKLFASAAGAASTGVEESPVC
jgi:hypothetical protein